MRMVKIQGAKSNIINTWIFPNDPRTCPVYAAELIGVGDSVRVAFIDIQAPVAAAENSTLKQRLESLSQAYRHLPCDEAAPNWATDASLGYFTYARNVPQSNLLDIHNGYLDYLDLFLNQMQSASGATQTDMDGLSLESARSMLHAYQLHHMHSSPGRKFLGNLFSDVWTEQFMLQFLFTLPQGNQ